MHSHQAKKCFIFLNLIPVGDATLYEIGRFLGRFPSAHSDILVLFVPRLSLVNVMKYTVNKTTTTSRPMIKNVYVFVVDVEGDPISRRCTSASSKDGFRLRACLKWIPASSRSPDALNISPKVKCCNQQFCSVGCISSDLRARYAASWI